MPLNSKEFELPLKILMICSMVMTCLGHHRLGLGGHIVACHIIVVGEYYACH